jgi:hypothetical protein|tara:strand:+ start:200 stop:463 length:264 start_codon:yes stop_codon:yes gene_type:complete
MPNVDSDEEFNKTMIVEMIKDERELRVLIDRKTEPGTQCTLPDPTPDKDIKTLLLEMAQENNKLRQSLVLMFMRMNKMNELNKMENE